MTNKTFALFIDPETAFIIAFFILSLAPVAISGITATIQEARKLYEEIKRWKW